MSLEMPKDFDFDTAIAALAESCGRPVKTWNPAELMRAFTYALHEIDDVLAEEFSERNRQKLVTMGVAEDEIQPRLLAAQASTVKFMVSVVVRVAGELDRRDPGGYVTPEHKWRPRMAEVLGNMLKRAKA